MLRKVIDFMEGLAKSLSEISSFNKLSSFEKAVFNEATTSKSSKKKSIQFDKLIVNKHKKDR